MTGFSESSGLDGGYNLENEELEEADLEDPGSASEGEENEDDEGFCDDEDDLLAQLIESEVLPCDSDEEEEICRSSKRQCVEVKIDLDASLKDQSVGFVTECKERPNQADGENYLSTSTQCQAKTGSRNRDPKFQPCAEDGYFSKIPADVIPRILKFLCLEDLVTCSLVCRLLNYAASDESLWRRLYCMRWGLTSPARLQQKHRSCAWKRLYIEQDKEDMLECVRNAPVEFREYYVQMQAAKRSQTPLPSQVYDEKTLIDATVSERITRWKHSRGLPDEFTAEHVCSGNTCSYSQIGDAFVCEKTGRVHVCDDTCREIVLDPSSDLLVCTISGRCFDRLLSPSEEGHDSGDNQGDLSTAVDEAEPFMGSGRFARAYLLGYNCDDEKELEAALAIC